MTEKEFAGARAYLTIPVGIARDKDLLKKPKTILLMGEILTMLNTTGSFYMSNSQIAKRLDVSRRTVSDYINILADKKLIAKEKIKDPHNDKIILGRKITAGAYLVKYTAIGWRDIVPQPSDTDCIGVRKHTSHKEYQSNKAVNKASNNSDQRSLTVKQIESEFESLWASYPNKKGKKDAFNHYKAWRKEKKAHTYLYMSQKLNNYLKYIRENNVKPRYIMHGSTWFNGRFDDDLKVDDVGSDPNDENSFTNLMKDDPGQPNEDDFPF